MGLLITGFTFFIIGVSFMSSGDLLFVEGLIFFVIGSAMLLRVAWVKRESFCCYESIENGAPVPVAAPESGGLLAQDENRLNTGLSASAPVAAHTQQQQQPQPQTQAPFATYADMPTQQPFGNDISPVSVPNLPPSAPPAYE
jgi:hypothetical protein